MTNSDTDLTFRWIKNFAWWWGYRWNLPPHALPLSTMLYTDTWQLLGVFLCPSEPCF